MKILLAPKYKDLQPFIDHIEDHFAQGESIYEARNSIRVCRYGDYVLNVKRFRQPNFFQRIVYTFFRQPKGLRAYRYPQYILAAGVETPEPVAYLENRKGGLLAESYFISLQCPYKHRFYEFATAEMDERLELLTRRFAQMTAKLHEAHLMHLDYSPGNILYDWVDGEPHFSLVDTNRMYFGRVNVKRGCQNFARLWGEPFFFIAIAEAYAEARHASKEQCTQWVMEARLRFWKRYVRKHGEPFPIKWH